MAEQVNESADVYRLVAWAHANRKQLIIALVSLVVIGAGISLYTWNADRREADASEAVSDLKLPTASAKDTTPPSPDGYLKLAQEDAGTSGGARALLIAAGILFDNGNFAQAQEQFEKFQQTYPENPLIAQAALGVAASLEAQGKYDQAATKYTEFIARHDKDSALPQAKSSLARVYVALHKPEQALKLYEELSKLGNNDSWSSEAGIQRQELLAKHPELQTPVIKPTVTPAPSPATITIPPAAAATPSAVTAPATAPAVPATSVPATPATTTTNKP